MSSDPAYLKSLSSQHENYIRLQRLLQYGRKVLEKHLKNQWKNVFGINMSDDVEAFRAFFKDDMRGQKMFTKKFTSAQRAAASQQPPSTWDICLLSLILRSDPFKSAVDTKPLSEIASVRNNLAHRPSFHVNSTDFRTLWQTLTVALHHFDSLNSPAEIETIRTAPVDDLTGADDHAVNETADSFKERGNLLYAERKYEEALLVYSDAMQLPNLSKRLLAILYSNRAMCYLKLSNPQSALQDAIRCQQTQPNWFKSYVRLGQSYMALDMPQKAADKFDRALQLPDINSNSTKDYGQVQNLKWSALRRVIVGRSQTVDRFVERLWLPIPGQEHVEKGHAFYFGTETVTRNTEKAIAEYTLGASAGNAEAMFNLAEAFMDIPSALDFAAAHKLLLQAAAMSPTLGAGDNTPRIGVDAAQYALGLNYQNGIYVCQDFLLANRWYERAISNGSAFAANNLGLMYLHGHQGLDRNFSQAEELFLLAYRRGERRAAPNLAILYTKLRQPSKVKQWYETAKLQGKMSRETEDACNSFLSKCGSVENELFDAFRPLFEAVQSTVNPVNNGGSHLPKFDVETLERYVSRGGGYAKTLLQSQTAFERAMKMLYVDTRDGSCDPIAFVDQYYLSLKIEPSGIICQQPESMARLVLNALSNYTKMQAGITSDTDMKARLILAQLTGYVSQESALSILAESIGKYPQCSQYYGLRGMLRCFQNDFEAALRDFNKVLELCPDSYEFLYDKAVALDHSQKDIKNARLRQCQEESVQKAYLEFLDRAPKDHRKVPAAYYTIAALHAVRRMNEAGIHSSNRKASQIVEEFRAKAMEAERAQMHYFLPYNEGSGKRALELYDTVFLVSEKMEGRLPLNETMESVSRRMADIIKIPSSEGKDATRSLSRLRTQLVLKHREAMASAKERSAKGWQCVFQSSTSPPQQSHHRSLLGLKGVTLRDLDTSTDYVATGRVLTVTIIEPPVLLVGIYFVVIDENDDAERLAIYNIPGQFPSNCDKFSVGTEIAIIEPYIRQCSDGLCAIRVDEPSSVMITGNQRRNMCRYCGKPNAPRRCSRCHEAAYCDKTCQIQDWKLLNHKSICEQIG